MKDKPVTIEQPSVGNSLPPNLSSLSIASPPIGEVNQSERPQGIVKPTMAKKGLSTTFTVDNKLTPNLRPMRAIPCVSTSSPIREVNQLEGPQGIVYPPSSTYISRFITKKTCNVNGGPSQQSALRQEATTMVEKLEDFFLRNPNPTADEQNMIANVVNISIMYVKVQ